MEAATAVFLRNGYPGTSMDKIAARAGVSKQTLYKHFADKKRLFKDIVLGTIDQVGEPFYDAIVRVRDADDLEKDLGVLARQLITIVMQPQLLRLRRLIIAEAGRFPDLGRTYYERGPGRTAATLASCLKHLSERGLLRLDDPRMAADHFIWLILSIPLNEIMLCGDGERYAAADLERFADAGVRVFLAAHAVISESPRTQVGPKVRRK